MAALNALLISDVWEAPELPEDFTQGIVEVKSTGGTNVTGLFAGNLANTFHHLASLSLNEKYSVFLALQGQLKARVTYVSAGLNFEPDNSFMGTYITPVESVKERFNKLYAEWVSNRNPYSSSLDDVLSDKAYLQIIKMGKSVLPYIFEKMKEEPDFWFDALPEITKEDPVTDDMIGDIEKMTMVWLEWAKKSGYA